MEGLTLHQTFGSTIRRKRMEKGFRRAKEFALAVSISPSFLCDIEKGRVLFSLPTLVKLAEALDTKPSELLEEAGL